MYLRYFALQDHPFAITPDPAFLYLSAHHREALGHLLYGTGERGGFVQLTGEVGTGKTTLIRALLEQRDEVAEVDVALCLNPQLTVNELLASICDELKVDYDENRELSLKYLIDRLNAHLLNTHAAGRRTVVIIDEAQNLSPEVLEQIRLLTNLETGTHKLLRIILVGQPELEDILARPDLRQLAQRITARFHLPGLSRAQTREYIGHRLRVAGGDPGIFPAAVCAAVYRHSNGIPRLINTICERALMGAYAQEKKPVTTAIVRQAAKETLPRTKLDDEKPTQQLVPVLVLVGAALFAFGLHYLVNTPWTQTPVLAPATAPPIAAAGQPGIKEKTDDKQESETHKKASRETPAYPLPTGDASMSQLLRLWGVFGAEVDVRCQTLSIGDLRCIRGHGDLDEVAQFNRPALITLREGDRDAWVLLSNLDADKATLILADGTREWPRAELLRLWGGEYQLIWRLQSPTRRISAGSVGSAVVWLRQRLALDDGVNLDAKAGPPSLVFDEALQAGVRRFQARRNMEVDGVVGARTMIALNNVAPSPGTPLLNPKQPAPAEDGAAPDEATAKAQGSACRIVSDLPDVQEVARLKFSASKAGLAADRDKKIAQISKKLAGADAIYIVGTAYDAGLSNKRRHTLAEGRAQSAAQGLAKLGVNPEHLNCIARSGAHASGTDTGREAIIYRKSQQSP